MGVWNLVLCQMAGIAAGLFLGVVGLKIHFWLLARSEGDEMFPIARTCFANGDAEVVEYRVTCLIPAVLVKAVYIRPDGNLEEYPVCAWGVVEESVRCESVGGRMLSVDTVTQVYGMVLGYSGKGLVPAHLLPGFKGIIDVYLPSDVFVSGLRAAEKVARWRKTWRRCDVDLG